MKLALIAPLEHLDWQTTGYQLMLPHLESDVDYSKAYRSFRNQGDFIILDNGAAESEQVSDTELLRIAASYKVNEIAIPDVLGDSQATYERLTEFFRKNEPRLVAIGTGLKSGPKLGFVAQGRDSEDAILGVIKIMNSAWEPYIHTVYLPRLLLETGNNEERTWLSLMIQNRFSERLEQHFFGSSPLWTREVMQVAAERPWVRGIDTSMPFNMALAGKTFMDSPSIWDTKEAKMNPAKRPENYFDLVIDDKELMEQNCAVFTKWVNSGPKAPTS